MKEQLKKTTISLSILLLLLHFPFVIITYTPLYYNSSIEQQSFPESISKTDAKNATANLRSYYFYQSDLNDQWNQKEKLHMYDVRKIFGLIHMLALAAVGILFLQHTRIKYSSKNLTTTGTILGCILVLIAIFFSAFWTAIHPIIFSNNFWILEATDISYYLFPLSFFRNIVIIELLVALLGILGITRVLKKR
jgi:uncharacterized membrane protein